MNENQILQKKYEEGEIILINKELHWTSFDVVNKIRKLLTQHLKVKKIKVGHAGTLDPLATGLVILCTGRKTKEIDNYGAQEKEYIADITFGATTPSFDLETEIDFRYDCSHITETLIVENLKKIIGIQEQTPPVYSAKKIDGVRAYEKAREGKPIKMKSAIIDIKEAQLISYQNSTAKIRIICSKGTYIRSLAYDFGKQLKSGAHLSSLVRTRIGNYLLQNALSISEFEKNL
jgi:tRNA pseudouridine55 synthase